jgi:hypothetical protein
MGEHPQSAVGSRSAYRLSPLWSLPPFAPLRGMCIVRERNYVLVWDENDSLHLFNAQGELQSWAKIQGELVAAAASDSGKRYVALTKDGNLHSLGPDLAVERVTPFCAGVQALVLDPHGDYIAFALADAQVGIADIYGRKLWREETPRPLLHLAFMPALPFLVGASSFGIITCFDFAGRCVWQKGLVSHIGTLAVRGANGMSLLACFSEGIQSYSFAGKDLGRARLPEPCRLLAVAYADDLVLATGLSRQVALADSRGHVFAVAPLEKPPAFLGLAAAGGQAFVAFQDGGVVSFRITKHHAPTPP